MDLRPRNEGKIRQLLEKGVEIPNPLTIDLGDEVRVGQVSEKGVKIFPGSRIYGEDTVISAGAVIGYEGPSTIVNCQIGPKVELRAGFFKESVFLEGSKIGPEAHVREGCILEEGASGAHCVAIKQTILFPFVTLGSLINFCDCLMAGGTGRRDHSEVGSSYIHFNFTPEGDKTTPSLIGDVPRGVMLRERPIFLGGQGGMAGPLHVNYGNVVAAGAILRNDLMEENQLVIGKQYKGGSSSFTPKLYRGLSRIVAGNISYLANLSALESWYVHVRRHFFLGQEFGDLMYRGALKKICLAMEERTRRLKAMAEKMPLSMGVSKAEGTSAIRKREFHEKVKELCSLFSREDESPPLQGARERFLKEVHFCSGSRGSTYLDTVKGLPDSAAGLGTQWLQQHVSELCTKAAALMPSLRLFNMGKPEKVNIE